MSNKSAVLTEIIARLTAGYGVGGTLNGLIKAAFVGSVEDSRKPNDTGYIILQLQGGKELAHYHNQGWADDMVIGMRIVVSKLSQAGNTLFNEAAGSGAIIVLDKVFNVIDKTVLGAVDLLLNGKAENIGDRSYTVSESDDMVDILVSMAYTSAHFQAGGR